jgi:arylsulfatase A-like enzyme
LRVPLAAWWPGRIRPAVVTAPGTTMDLYTTAIAVAGGTPPTDRPLDGYDIQPVLLGTGTPAREAVFYWRQRELYAVRQGAWKARFINQGAYGQFAIVSSTRRRNSTTSTTIRPRSTTSPGQIPTCLRSCARSRPIIRQALQRMPAASKRESANGAGAQPAVLCSPWR